MPRNWKRSAKKQLETGMVRENMPISHLKNGRVQEILIDIRALKHSDDVREWNAAMAGFAMMCDESEERKAIQGESDGEPA